MIINVCLLLALPLRSLSMDPEMEPLTGLSASQPTWYTPKRLLALFCWLTFLIYLDQGVVASNGVNRPIQVWPYPSPMRSPSAGHPCCAGDSAHLPSSRSTCNDSMCYVCALWLLHVQAEFQLGNVEDGLLPSAFLAGLLIASIVYSELTNRYNAFRMIGKFQPTVFCIVAI